MNILNPRFYVDVRDSRKNAISNVKRDALLCGRFTFLISKMSRVLDIGDNFFITIKMIVNTL